MPDIYKNRCYRNAPCLFGIPKKVKRNEEWDYYDRSKRTYVSLECRIHNKYYLPSIVETENQKNYESGISTETREHPDLQLADSNGIWWTNSNDPEMYHYDYFKDSIEKQCSDCDTICEIRNWEKYLNKDGTCPYPDPSPQPIYKKVKYDEPCDSFLHPLLLQDIDAINRKRRRMAKTHIWKYLKQPKWMHALINSEQTMMQVWRRNYRPAQVYFSSFEMIKLYLKTMPEHMKQSKRLVQRIQENIKKSPSARKLVQESWYEEDLRDEVERCIGKLLGEKASL